MIQLSPSGRANALALVTIPLLLAGFGAIGFGGFKESSIAGPNAITVAEDGMVYFRAGERLFGATPKGETRSEATLQDLGLGADIADLEVLDDRLLVADGTNGAIVWCERDLSACPERTPLPKDLRSRVFYFTRAPSPADDRFYIISSQRHRLDVIDFAGQHKYRMRVPDGLFFPNEVQVLADGTVAVADTNHHRLVGLQDTGTEETHLAWSIDADTEMGRLRRIWPVALREAPNGHMWAIIANDTLQLGDVIRFDRGGNPLERLALPEDADPTSLAFIGTDLVVTDYRADGVLRVGPNGKASDFAQGGLKASLGALHAERQQWAAVVELGWGLVTLALLPGIAAVFFDWRARREQEAAERMAASRPERTTLAPQRPLQADKNGVVWLEKNPKFMRLIRLFTIGGPTLMLAGLAPLVYLSEDFGAVFWAPLLGMIILFALIHLYLYTGLKRTAIGTDGSEVHLRDMRGNTDRIPVRDIIDTGTRLIGPHIKVMYKSNRGQFFFDKEQFIAHMCPVLKDAQNLSEGALWWRRMKMGDAQTWLATVASAALLAAIIWIELVGF